MIAVFQDSVFATLHWTDVLDILLLAFLLYRGFLIIRGTRALQILVGLILLLVLYIASQQLDLTAVHWMLDRFAVYLVLAVVILFQNDIRRGLARAGGQLFQGPGGIEEGAVHEAVVRAAFALASRRIGAIIAIERTASLDELVDSGHPLDSRVSQDLLLSIFHPTSPLHDGAVVIQKGRLAAAQTFLNLSLSRDIARYYGTRHRAALGLSEETDAVAVVVSEERGGVSLVLGGALTPIPDVDTLRERLQEIFMPSRRGALRPAGPR